MKSLRLGFLILIFPVADCLAQSVNDSISVAGSPDFRINKSRSFWMGSNYRKEWTTPIRVPVVNLATEKGGLKPEKRGGGKQTRSLRMVDPQGNEYNFRSIQKFITSKTLPGDLQSEAAKDLVADGISASYPYSALSMPVLAEAAGVPYLKVKLVFIPDDLRLGEFRKDFGNLLAYLEEKLPDTVQKGYDTEDVVKKLSEDNDNSVDQQALLRARILDMFVMDFDRHEGQWEWGAIDKEKGKMFYPIPKDRDQAFYVNQGVVPHIAQWPWLVPQLEGLKPQAKNIMRFNFAARNLDRFFLNGLNEQDWKSAADKFLSQMTDSVIENAMAQQPKEIKHYSANKISDILKQRRNYLSKEVMEYYRFLGEKVDVLASNKTELFDITRHDDGSVLLKVYKLGKDGDSSLKMYERTFDPQHTEEIRLYGFGGDDKFFVNGSNDKIKIRLIGGKGNDEFKNSASSGDGVIVYDEKRGNNTLSGPFKNKMANDSIVNSYDPIYYKYNQIIPFVSVGYNPDDGIYLGGYMKIIRHGFRKTPYKNSHTITLNQALASKAFNFSYNAEFISVFGKNSDLLFETDINSPTITNFFGFGNATIYDKTKPGKFRYYRTRYRLGDISLLLRKNFSEKVIMTLGPTFQFYDMDSADKNNRGRFIVQSVSSSGIDPSTAFAKQSYFGGQFTLTADTRDNAIIPQKGIYWHTSVRHLSGLKDNNYQVTQLNSGISIYLSLIKNFLVLANRTGGGHNFGDFEFYQAQYLGSEDNLRGYRKNRFAGHSKIYNNLELRLKLTNFKTYLFPGSLGLLGFYDTGRIWSDSDASDKWLTGYGAGFWISPLRRLVLTFSFAASEEDKIPLIGIGWKF
ncbi:MAG: BamA/TamA family outer membrane protein [Chitinophagaceae bacterium]